jgi:hypothetical protein
MGDVTPLPKANSGAECSEATRFLCASVFLGHDDVIRKQLRALVINGHHYVADNHGLNVRLLARVLDFFDQKRFRYLAWHGPIGVFCFSILAVALVEASEDTQPTIIALIVLAAVLFAVAPYRQWLKNRYDYAQRYFARETFDEKKAMEAFTNSSGKLETDVAAQDTSSNVTAFSRFDPFVGAGQSLGNWSLLIDTRKGKDGETPDKFTAQELERAVAAAFRQLPLPDLKLGERLFVHGQDVGFVEGLLPDRFARPRQRVSEETLARFRQNDSREARVYQFVEVLEWADQVCISSFYRAVLKGPMLYVENYSRVLQPVGVKYRGVDDLTPLKASKKIGLFVGHTLMAPFVCIGNCFGLYGRLQAHGEARKLEREQKDQIEEQARFNYGATESLRGSFADAIYDHFFEKSDRDLYVKAIQKQMLDSIIDFLDERNVDISDLRDQRSLIVNSGLIVHGDVQAAALAVGEKAKAHSEASLSKKARNTAAGGAAL